MKSMQNTSSLMVMKMIVLEHQQGHRAIEISENSLLSTRSIPMSCRGESITDDEILLAHRDLALVLLFNRLKVIYEAAR